MLDDAAGSTRRVSIRSGPGGRPRTSVAMWTLDGQCVDKPIAAVPSAGPTTWGGTLRDERGKRVPPSLVGPGAHAQVVATEHE